MNWSLLSWLRQPYPFSNNWKASFSGALGTGFFVSFFLFVFKPFGMRVAEDAVWNFLQICLMFGGVTVVVTLIVNGITVLLPRVFDEEKWVIGKEILFNLLFIGCIGTGNLLLAHWLWDEPLSVVNLWRWQFVTVAVALFPMILGISIIYVRRSHKYAQEAAMLALKPHAQEHEQEMIVRLEGENSGELLTVLPSQLVYIAAADNYVRVYFFINSELRHQMLRATLKKMEDALAGFPQMLRCHRTFLVNLEYVDSVSGNAQGYRLHLHGVEDTIPVSRNLNAVVQSRLK